MDAMTTSWKNMYEKLGEIDPECPRENPIIKRTMNPRVYKERADTIVETLDVGGSILEIGCGYGGLALEVLKIASVPYTVVDNELMLNQTKKFLGDKVEYVVADKIETLQNRKFGLFVSDFCLNEVPPEYREYIFENIIKNCQKISVLDTDWYDIEKHIRRYFKIEKISFRLLKRFTFAGKRIQ